MLSMEQLRGLFGRKVVGNDGGSLGEVDRLYADRDDGQPIFASVRTGASRSYFVPLDGARLDGEIVTLAYDVVTVTTSPNTSPGGELSEEEESRLYKHYGMSGSSAGTVENESEVELGHPVGMAGLDNPAVATDHPSGMAGIEGAPSWPAPHEAGMAGNEPYPADHPLGMAGKSTIPSSRLRRWTGEPTGTEGRRAGTTTTRRDTGI